MQSVLLIRYGEIGLKGQNRSRFEKTLLNNIAQSLGLLKKHVRVHHGRIYAFLSKQAVDFDQPQCTQYLQRLGYVFGIVGAACAYRLPANANLDTVKQAIDHLVANTSLRSDRTFRISTHKVNKAYPYGATQLNYQLGYYVGQNQPQWQVDLDHPDYVVHLECRNEGIFLYSNRYQVQGPGGLPTGVSGNGLLLLSGGIDSPVAGWMMLKRGMNVDPVYFHSYPYTSEQVKEKVTDLARALVAWKGRPMTLYIPYFTGIQIEINKKCPESTWTLLHRRYMMRIAERIANQPQTPDKKRYHTLITGENLSQVASQTVENIDVINQATHRPIFRPLIGFDKQEIVSLSEKIETFNISKAPYVDCCTMFAPSAPETKAKIGKIEQAEANLDQDKLIQKAIDNMEMVTLSP